MSIASVNASKDGARVTTRKTDGGRAGFDGQGSVLFNFHEEIVLTFGDRDVAVSAGNSAGMKLPESCKARIGVVFGNPLGTAAALAALGSDDLRDNSIVLDDTVAPVGSEVLSFHQQIRPGAQPGGFANAPVVYGVPAAEYPNGIQLRTGATTGAPGTGNIQCSSDGGTTWCTQYVTVASGVNTVKDSAGNDTGLRFRLTTTPSFAAGDTALIDLKTPSHAKKWLKTAPGTWTQL